MKKTKVIWLIPVVLGLSLLGRCGSEASNQGQQQQRLEIPASALTDAVKDALSENQPALENLDAIESESLLAKAHQSVLEETQNLICARGSEIFLAVKNEADQTNDSVRSLLFQRLKLINDLAIRQSQGIETYSLNADEANEVRAYLLDSLALMQVIHSLEQGENPAFCEVSPRVTSRIAAYLDVAYRNNNDEQ